MAQTDCGHLDRHRTVVEHRGHEPQFVLTLRLRRRVHRRTTASWVRDVGHFIDVVSRQGSDADVCW